MSGRSFDEFTLAAVVEDLDRPVPNGYADAIEFRMDGATDPLAQLDAYAGALPVIATNRASWEGGNADADGRLATLKAAAEDPAVAAVDIELDAIDDPAAETLRTEAGAQDTAIIVSWHDFEGTPPRSTLAERLSRAVAWGDIGKLAVTADTIDDVLEVLTLTREQTRAGHRVATMCMGRIGRHSRIIAPLYGSKIGYAPIDASEATAPGQYPLVEMAELIRALEA